MRTTSRFVGRTLSAAFLLLLFPFTTIAVTLTDPDNFGVKKTWSGSSLGLPGNLGGLLFSPDGRTLYVVGDSETLKSALFAVPVTRDPATNEITDLGPADQVTVVFEGSRTYPGLDAGWEVGPAGTLFYTYWPSHRVAERPGGVSGAETLFDMFPVGLPDFVAGLTFSPHITDPNTGFGVMQVSIWDYGKNRDLYNVVLNPVGEGLFQPKQIELFVRLPWEGTGSLQYIPAGPFEGSMMYVNWDYGEVKILLINRETGLPVDDGTGLPTLGTVKPRVLLFASGFGKGPWGLEFDPITNDFFVSTWSGDPHNTIIQIGDKGVPPAEDPRITSVWDSVLGLTVHWYGPAGWTHTLEYSPLLVPADWQQVLSVEDAPAVNEKTLPMPFGTSGFYRVVCTEP